MSRVLVMKRTGFISRLASLRRLAPARDERIVPRGLTRAADVRAMPGTASGQQAAGMSFAAAAHDHDAGLLDAAAGSEYLDDRIRLAD